MINKYVPQAPTSTSEIYCDLVRDIKNIKAYDSFADFMESKVQHDALASPEFLLNFMKFENIIDQQVRYNMPDEEQEENEYDNELMRELKIKQYHSIEELIETNIGERRDYMIYLWGNFVNFYLLQKSISHTIFRLTFNL